MKTKENNKTVTAPVVNNRGRKPGVTTCVSINISKLANLVGEGTVEVRRSWLENLLFERQKESIESRISDLTEPCSVNGHGKQSIEMNIEE